MYIAWLETVFKTLLKTPPSPISYGVFRRLGKLCYTEGKVHPLVEFISPATIGPQVFLLVKGKYCQSDPKMKQN